MTDARQDLKWEEVRRTPIVQNEWIDLRETAYRMPDGSISEPYYSYSRRDYAVIAATDDEGRFICVRQYRHGIGEVTTEFPAGGLEREDGQEYSAGGKAPGTEDPMIAARRELLEETGYESDCWEHLLTIPASATINDNYAYIYRARNCRRVQAQDLDDTEFLNVELIKPEELENLVKTGGFQQSVHVMAWLLAKEADRYGKA